jgi:hypothetical protein
VDAGVLSGTGPQLEPAPHGGGCALGASPATGPGGLLLAFLALATLRALGACRKNRREQPRMRG